MMANVPDGYFDAFGQWEVLLWEFAYSHRLAASSSKILASSFCSRSFECSLTLKGERYVNIQLCYLHVFFPIAIETHVAIGTEAIGHASVNENIKFDPLFVLHNDVIGLLIGILVWKIIINCLKQTYNA